MVASEKTQTFSGSNKPSPARHVRVSDALWDSITKKAQDEAGIGPSELVRALLRAYERGEIKI